MMKRIMLLATVAALMAVMLVAGAASAVFAHDQSPTGCGYDPNKFAISWPQGQSPDRNNDGIVCNVNKKQGGVRYTDNHPPH